MLWRSFSIGALQLVRCYTVLECIKAALRVPFAARLHESSAEQMCRLAQLLYMNIRSDKFRGFDLSVGSPTLKLLNYTVR